MFHGILENMMEFYEKLGIKKEAKSNASNFSITGALSFDQELQPNFLLWKKLKSPAIDFMEEEKDLIHSCNFQ